MAFTPVVTKRLEVSDTSEEVMLRADLPTLLLQNAGPAIAFVRFGVGVQDVAAHIHLPVLPGHMLLLSKGVGADSLAAICARGDEATLYVTVGSGE